MHSPSGFSNHFNNSRRGSSRGADIGNELTIETPVMGLGWYHHLSLNNRESIWQSLVGNQLELNLVVKQCADSVARSLLLTMALRFSEACNISIVRVRPTYLGRQGACYCNCLRYRHHTAHTNTVSTHGVPVVLPLKTFVHATYLYSCMSNVASLLSHLTCSSLRELYISFHFCIISHLP